MSCDFHYCWQRIVWYAGRACNNSVASFAHVHARRAGGAACVYAHARAAKATRPCAIRL